MHAPDHALPGRVEGPVLDLRDCGIGNVVLMAAGYLDACEAWGVAPRIYHDAPHELDVIDLTGIEIVDTDADVDPAIKPGTCNLPCLYASATRMRRLVRPVDVPLDMTGVDAGFCFRVSAPALDGHVQFMNDAAVQRMMLEMGAYRRPFVCANDAEVLRRVLAAHPHAVSLGAEDTATRNAAHHVVQFHALARCPVVYHGIGSDDPAAGGVTSTFAPVAAAYGGAKIVGVDNTGGLFSGATYRW
jgi:hypothetical protein